jgi:hypothetical protein
VISEWRVATAQVVVHGWLERLDWKLGSDDGSSMVAVRRRSYGFSVGKDFGLRERWDMCFDEI